MKLIKVEFSSGLKARRQRENISMTFTFHCKLQTGLRNFAGILSKVAKIFVNYFVCVNKISAQKVAVNKSIPRAQP